MSAALLRQSLELVDSEGRPGGKKKKRDVKRSLGQVAGRTPYKRSKKVRPADVPSDQRVEETVKKLQALSTPTLDRSFTDKIFERAVKSKAVDKIEVPVVENKPILFTEETFKQFEKELFCS